MAERKPRPGRKAVKAAAKPSSSDTIVETRPSAVWQGVTYMLVWDVRRGPGPERKRRGPYWRAYWWDSEHGRTKSKFIGKEFTETKLKEGDF